MSGRYQGIKKLCCFEIKYRLVRSRRGLEEEREKITKNVRYDFLRRLSSPSMELSLLF